MEHERWLRREVADLWRYGPQRDDVQKTNPALKPWRKLKTDVRVGVTGHRILADQDKIAHGIEAGLGHIRTAFPKRTLIVVSPLAEGADRLVAQGALAYRETQLVVPLPLPQDDYIQDFASDASKAEFSELLKRATAVVTLAAQPTRNEAYAAVGEYVLDHCDVLIAVWDGKDAQGQGGTAEIVAKARQRELPIVWVHAGNRSPGTEEPTSLDSEQGVVSYEGL